MSLWAFLSTLSAARGSFTWPGSEVLPTERNLITSVHTHTHTFPVRKHIFYSLTAGREYCCYRYSTVCVYSDVQASPSAANRLTDINNNRQLCPARLRDQKHSFFFFFSSSTSITLLSHIHTPSLHPPVAVLLCVDVMLLATETALSNGLVTHKLLANELKPSEKSGTLNWIFMLQQGFKKRHMSVVCDGTGVLPLARRGNLGGAEVDRGRLGCTDPICLQKSVVSSSTVRLLQILI